MVSAVTVESAEHREQAATAELLEPPDLAAILARAEFPASVVIAEFLARQERVDIREPSEQVVSLGIAAPLERAASLVTLVRLEFPASVVTAA